MSARGLAPIARTGYQRWQLVTNLSPTHLKSSRGRSNALPAALMTMARSQATCEACEAYNF